MPYLNPMNSYSSSEKDHPSQQDPDKIMERMEKSLVTENQGVLKLWERDPGYLCS